MFRTILVVCGSSIVLMILAASSAEAALVSIDHDVTIDATNSYPEPPLGQPPLTVEIVNGQNGPSTVDVEAGGVIGGLVNVRGESHLRIAGGQIQALTRVLDNATITLTSGSIEPLIGIYVAASPSTLLHLLDSATANIRGGALAPNSIRLEDASALHIYGRAFLADGAPPSELLPSAGNRFQGVYSNGDPFDILVYRSDLSTPVFLHVVPEPSAMAMACVMGIAWFGTFAPKCQRSFCDSSGLAIFQMTSAVRANGEMRRETAVSDLRG